MLFRSEIVYVDGTMKESENNIIWRAADLLSVPSRQRIELRQQIAALSVAGLDMVELTRDDIEVFG